MIHDPTFPITCDAEGCDAEDEMNCTYRGVGPTRGGYVDDGDLPHGWVAIGGDEHLCEDCAAKREVS